MEGVLREREEAYEACAAFQDEIYVLRKEADEMKIRHLAELTKVCEALTLELEQKNAAMKSIQIAMGALKAEQRNVKAAAVALGKENARLLREGAAQE